MKVVKYFPSDVKILGIEISLHIMMFLSLWTHFLSLLEIKDRHVL